MVLLNVWGWGKVKELRPDSPPKLLRSIKSPSSTSFRYRTPHLCMHVRQQSVLFFYHSQGGIKSNNMLLSGKAATSKAELLNARDIVVKFWGGGQALLEI